MPRGRRQVAEARTGDRERARQWEAAQRRDRGQRGAAEQHTAARRPGLRVARQRRGREVADRERVGRETDRGVDHARPEVDLLPGEELSKDDAEDPRRRDRAEHRGVAAAGRDREHPRDAARDHEEDEHADDEEALRPEVKELDERDGDPAREDVDDRLTERERREWQTDEGNEERDVQREEHREHADEQPGALARRETSHIWHDTTRCQSFFLRSPRRISTPSVSSPTRSSRLTESGWPSPSARSRPNAMATPPRSGSCPSTARGRRSGSPPEPGRTPSRAGHPM